VTLGPFQYHVGHHAVAQQNEKERSDVFRDVLVHVEFVSGLVEWDRR